MKCKLSLIILFPTLIISLSSVNLFAQADAESVQEQNTDAIGESSINSNSGSDLTLSVNSRKRVKSIEGRDKKQRPKSERPPEAPRSSYSPAPFSFSILRFLQLNQSGTNTGLFYTQTGLNTPGSTYLLTTLALASPASARSFTDYYGFSAGLNIYSPQIAGFGIASTLSVAGANTDTWRGGPYHAFMTRLADFNFFMFNHLLLNRTSDSSGRFLNLWILSFAEGLISAMGSISYTWNNDLQPQVNLLVVDNTVSIRVYQTIRFTLLYSQSQSGSINTSTTGAGLEINQRF